MNVVGFNYPLQMLQGGPRNQTEKNQQRSCRGDFSCPFDDACALLKSLNLACIDSAPCSPWNDSPTLQWRIQGTTCSSRKCILGVTEESGNESRQYDRKRRTAASIKHKISICPYMTNHRTKLFNFVSCHFSRETVKIMASAKKTKGFFEFPRNSADFHSSWIVFFEYYN